MSASTYSVVELLEIIRTNPDSTVRVIAAEMLYKMGERDQMMKSISRDLNAPAGLVA